MKEYNVILNIDTEQIMNLMVVLGNTMEDDIKTVIEERLAECGIEVLSVTEKG